MHKQSSPRTTKRITLEVECETADLIAELKKEWDSRRRGKALSWIMGFALDEALRAYESDAGLRGSGQQVDGRMIWSVPRLQVAQRGLSHHAEALIECAAIERVLAAATVVAETVEA